MAVPGGGAVSYERLILDDGALRLQSAFRVFGLGFGVSALGFQISGFGFRVSCSGFKVSGFGFRV